jgi:hypothetical protein
VQLGDGARLSGLTLAGSSAELKHPAPFVQVLRNDLSELPPLSMFIVALCTSPTVVGSSPISVIKAHRELPHDMWAQRHFR